MDWLMLFAVLVVIGSVHTAPEVSKKKIRIHLPQKVKHIHHHKKIYITNHPASSQYAPAFMPSAEGAVAVPSNVAMPAVAKYVNPYNSFEVYDEPPTRLPAITSASSKILPLYRARGYYGPTPSDLDDDDDQQDSADGSYIPTAFAAPTAPAATPPNYSKKVKYVKLDEPKKKKIPRKLKSKRVMLRNKPLVEEEHPVSTFHEQFYSDLGGSGTIRKIKKPQRVEKIIDGDTEHIHTYSEEHIHKIVFDEGSKVKNVVGIDSVGNMAAFAPSHHIASLKNTHSFMPISSDTLTGFTADGTMGPSHVEYSYNPREVTHDHIFHDHGEIPSDIDITKGHVNFPHRISHSGQSLGALKGNKNKYLHHYVKSTKSPQVNDFSYYENIYPNHRYRNIQKPVIPTVYAPIDDVSFNDVQAYKPIPSFKLKDQGVHIKSRNIVPALYFDNSQSVDDRQPKVSAPYAVSSTIVHDYKPKQYMTHGTGNSELSNLEKDFYNYPTNYDMDSYASASNIFTSDSAAIKHPNKKGKKKSISTQNVSFGGLGHLTNINQYRDSGVMAASVNEVAPTSGDNFGAINNFGQTRLIDTLSSTAYTIKESSPVHPYYSVMAVKALHGNDPPLPEASNDNFQYVEAPTPVPTTSTEDIISTPPSEHYNKQESVVTEATGFETKAKHSSAETNSGEVNVERKPKRRYKVIAIKSVPTYSRHESHIANGNSPSVSSKLKYGDKI